MDRQRVINRKFQNLIWSFGSDCHYNRTLAAEWQYQADLQQRSKIQNDTSDEVSLILLWTYNHNLTTGEKTFEESEAFNKSRETK